MRPLSKKISALSLLAALGFSSALEAAILGPFDQALTQYTQDGVLDSQEYSSLKYLYNQGLAAEDKSLAQHFLNFAAKHPGYIRMSYSYYRQRQKVTLSFAFAPSYAEDSFIQGASSREVLSQISQNDVLVETTNDPHRCGAAALLAAHYLLYGSLDYAFERLGVPHQGMTYRAVHLAQEQLYRKVNLDGKPGLVSIFRFTQYSDGRVAKPIPAGEVKEAAQLMKLKMSPMIGPTQKRFYDRTQTIKAFWSLYPDAVFLVGVYLDEKSGNIRPPDARNYVQNHFVLVFRQNNQLWLYNSGVLDNGRGRALSSLNSTQANALFYRGLGTVDALSRF